MQLKKKTFTGTTSNEVTARETENRKIARQAAAEGFVLLKNEDHILPIKNGAKLGLYGAGAVKTIKGGTGSGDVNERECINICQGLKNAGYEITSDAWLEAYASLYEETRLKWRDEILGKLPAYNNNFFEAYSTTPFFMPCGNPVDVEKAALDGADTAIYVLSRIAGENADRHDTEGDYYISAEEKALIAQLSKAYDSLVLVINTGGLVDLAFAEEFDNIKAVLQFVQAGQEGGNAFADVISGKVTPSGKLADTWALDYKDYPSSDTFSFKNGDVNTEKYQEGIYVGYRYFDTFDVPVRYPFGYGLSYTDFSVSTKGIEAVNTESGKPEIAVTVEVTNTGDTYCGKEVVQIYVSCPQGKLAKEYRRLAGFAKTEELKPQESCSMTITFPVYQLASFDEEKAAWILEGGTYGIWVGSSIQDAEPAGSLCLNKDAVLVQCEHICPLKEELKELTPDHGRMMEKEAAWLEKTAGLPCVHMSAENIGKEIVVYSELPEHFTGRAGEIVESLSREQLVLMATGDPGKGQDAVLGSAGITVPGAAAETSSAATGEPWNLPSMALADGPAGLRLNQKYQVVDGEIVPENFMNSIEKGFFAESVKEEGTSYYQFCTAIPVGTLLAQTWNAELVKEVGEMIGKEMELFQVTLWLAPGMNIHRNPLCGRNFEYYSEDPLLSGIMASAMTLGVQKVPGCGTTIKHFACNNQEDNRMGSDSVLSERALREIYLKGFEIAVKNSQPMSIMTSYNMINGVHAANCYDICTRAARDEWGFAGAIMTDWTTTFASPRGECTAAGCMRAGNDMVMPGIPQDHENIRQELSEGALSIQELRRCICNTVNLILQSNRYEDAVSYLEQFTGLDSYLKVEK